MNPNDSSSPLPQPNAYTCSHCGFGWNEDSAFCPRCGAAQTPVEKQKRSALAIFGYGCGFMFFGALGACVSIGSIGGVRDWLNIGSVIGFLFVVFALYLLWKLVRGGR